jgi:hypothetical protein
MTPSKVSDPINGKQAKKHTIHALACFGFIQILPEKVFKASTMPLEINISQTSNKFFELAGENFYATKMRLRNFKHKKNL